MKRKLIICIFMMLFSFFAFTIPYTICKYTTVINSKITVNASQPKYTVRFLPNILPPEYQEVETIEADGTQWIDTDVSMNSDYTLYADGFMTRGQLGVLISGYYNSSNRQEVIFYTGSNKYGYSWFGTGYRENTTLSSVGIDLKERFQYTQSRRGITLTQGDISVSDTYNAGAATHSQHIYLFASNSKPGSLYGTIYNVKILYGARIIKNFIPCYRKSDGEIGVYDTIDDRFYTNNGSGAFIKGNDVSYDQIDQSFTYNVSQKLLKNTFVKEGYKFAGWSTSPYGLGTIYGDEEVVDKLSSTDGDVVLLYAFWELE